MRGKLVIKSGILLFVLGALVQCGFAQTKAGNSFFESFHFEKAIPNYEKALKKNPEDSIAIVRLAECYYQVRDYAKAETAFKTAADKFPANNELSLRYAQLLKINNKIKKAKEVFIVYASRNPNDKNGNNYVLSCDKIRSWSASKPVFKVNNFEKANSEFADFSPTPYHDGIALVTNRFVDLIDDTEANSGGGYLTVSHIQINSKDSSYNRLKPFHTAINGNYHNGPISFTADYSKAVLSKSEPLKGRKKQAIHPQVYEANGNGKRWNKPTSFQHNNPDYSLTHPAISPDGSLLFFASNLPGGFGGMDLYYCTKNDNGWSEPINAGNKLNTTGNEVFPTLYNNNTLYFSSDGHIGIGALDIFKASKVDGVWTLPSNLKTPLNSNKDDFGLVFTDSIHGFFSSNRDGGKGEDDIYQFIQLVPEKEPVEVSGMFVYSELDPAANTEIKLLDEDGNVIMITTTDENGKFAFKGLESDQNYMFLVDENDPNLTDQSSIFLTNENDEKIVALAQPLSGQFKFRALEPEHFATLPPIETEDTQLTFLDIFGQIFDKLPGDYSDSLLVHLIDDNGDIIYTTFVNEEGKFHFENLLSDKNYKLKLNNDTLDYQMAFFDLDGEKITDAERTDNAEYVFMSKTIVVPFTSTVFGRVYQQLPGDYTGGMEIHLVNDDGEILYTTVVNKDGTFNFEKLPEDHDFQLKLGDLSDVSYKVVTLTEDGEPDRLLTKNDNNIYVLNAREKLSLMGKVFQKLPGDYGAGMEVYLVDDDGNIVYTTVTDENGDFNFENLPPDHNLNLKLKNTADDLQMVMVEEDKTNMFGNLYQKLPGDYGSGMEVYLVDDDGNIVYTTIADENGNFNFENLPPDHNFKLKVKDADADFNMVLLNEYGEMQTAQVTPEGYTLEEIARRNMAGNLYQTLPGDYAGGMEVYLVDDDGNIVYTAVTDEKGNFNFENLPADHHYKLKVKDAEDLNMVLLNEFGEMANPVTKNEKGEFMEHQQTQSVFGRAFTELPSDNSAGMEVYLVDDSGNIVYTAITDENGNFNFENLPIDKNYVIRFNEQDSEMKLMVLDDSGNELGEVDPEKGDFDYRLLSSKKNYISLITENDAVIKVINDEAFVLFKIYYDYDQTYVRKNSRPELMKLITLMQNNPHIKVVINAYADGKGSNEYNNRLTTRRAWAARDFLTKNGITKERIIAEGKGESKPIAPNTLPDGSDNPNGRKLNRRAEITILKLE